VLANRVAGLKLQVWSNSYPELVQGMPGTKYTSPEKLKAFNEHCATISEGAKSAIYMNSKGLQV